MLLQDEDSPTLGEYADDPEELRKLVNLFFLHADKGIVVLSQNCTDGPNQDWVEEVHKFKGAAAIGNAKKLVALCERAEAMAIATATERKAILGEILEVYTKTKITLLNSLPQRADSASA